MTTTTTSRLHRLVRRAGAGVVLALVAALVPVLVSTPQAGALWPSTTVDIRGHGWGHGRGLGQYGALGYAIDEGWNHQQILDHYYGGTTAGTKADGPISVHLTDFDSRDLIVTSPGASFTVASTTFTAGQAARIRRSGNSWVVEPSSSGCAGPWGAAVQTLDISLHPTAGVIGDPGDDVNRMLVACGTNSRAYRGTIAAIASGAGAIAVNQVSMESYLRGVVPRESPASWADLGGGKGMEALESQAVAARSYAWAENRSPGVYQTCDTTSCQVYGGAGLNGARIEDPRSDAAIAQTAGVVRVKNGAVQRTEFSSSTGGYTAGGTFPAVPDAGDDTASNPNHNWSVRLAVGTIESAYPAIGRLENIAVQQRNGLGEDGGRVTQLAIGGTSGNVTVSGAAFAGAVGLKSDWFRIVSLSMPAVSIAPTSTGKGYWLASNDGGVFAYGDASFYGSAGGIKLNRPVVGMAARPDSGGYWLVATDGGIFSYGNAGFYGSTGGIRLNKPVVGMASTPSGGGYWLVASDGGIFAYGDAGFYGSAGAIKLNRPIVGMAARPDGRGYWLVADDGGIFSYGSAPFLGAATGSPKPIVSMARTPSGNGYWVLGSDGNVFVYGDASI
ncbi:MAG TPA: SpoIID/LytB domain-containing protein [Acidimicrobiales bacterium]